MVSASALAILLNLLFAISVALKCKCTHSSNTAECIHGICDILSEPAACVMLNHPKTGVHYACSSNDLPDRLCQERNTKSNATVNICFCRDANYCNYSYWPDDLTSTGNKSEIAESSAQKNQNSTRANKFDLFLIFSIFTTIISILI